MTRGIDLYTNGNYEGAVTEFKRVAALSPVSDNAITAYNYSAMAYLKLGRTDDAIKTYKTAMRVSPTDDTLHLALGNIYYDQNNYDSAVKEYQAAVNLNSQDTTNWYSLGQALISTGNYDKAEDAFTKVKQIAPQDYSGYYGLGQVSYKQGDYEKAIGLFQKVLEIKHDFTAAHVDLGYAYADMGDFDKAKEQVKLLNGSDDQSSASLLDSYIYQKTPPKLFAAYTAGGFDVSLGPGTEVSTLAPSLSTGRASKTFTMDFIFSKSMDAASVQNPYNWQISRAAYGTPGGAYNWGLSVPSTEAQISLNPINVVYKADQLTAEVTFQIKQNSSADATIDPSHIIFKCAAKDAYGNAMDTSANEYGGFSAIV